MKIYFHTLGFPSLTNQARFEFLCIAMKLATAHQYLRRIILYFKKIVEVKGFGSFSNEKSMASNDVTLFSRLTIANITVTDG